MTYVVIIVFEPYGLLTFQGSAQWIASNYIIVYLFCWFALEWVKFTLEATTIFQRLNIKPHW